MAFGPIWGPRLLQKRCLLVLSNTIRQTDSREAYGQGMLRVCQSYTLALYDPKRGEGQGGREPVGCQFCGPLGPCSAPLVETGRSTHVRDPSQARLWFSQPWGDQKGTNMASETKGFVLRRSSVELVVVFDRELDHCLPGAPQNESLSSQHTKGKLNGSGVGCLQ